MVKETEDIEKKRRKLDESPLRVENTENLLPVYERVAECEESMAAERNPEEDLALYREACVQFVTIIDEIEEAKTKKEEGWESVVQEKKLDATLLTVLLKKLNRLEKVRTKNTRENLSKVKQQVDSYQLQLENLLCEILHLKKEVDKCLHFKSKDLGIELVPLEQFYEEAPESISRPEITKVDEHQRQLARLEWELKERKQLAVLCGELEAKKQIVAAQINKRKTDLDSLAPLIKEVLTVTKPMQENLGLPVTQSSCNHEVASLLPHPLYYLYVQSDAYREACDKKLFVSVTGDEEEAKVIKQQFTDVVSSEESDSDGQEEEEQKPHHRKKSRNDRKEEKKNRLLMKHPLSVGLKIELKSGDSISLQFYYLVSLNILTVVPTLQLKRLITSSAACQLLSNDSILSNLFPNDAGLDSPNIANYYQLRKVGLSDFDVVKLGLPYIWVQRIGGLDFAGQLNHEKKVESKREIAQTSIPNVIKEIRRRVRARIALASQIIALENGTVTGPDNMSSVKLSCELKNWQILSWSDYCKYEFTSKLVEIHYVSLSDIFYKALITRADAKLTLLVAIRPSYPCSPPVFSISLEKSSKTYTSLNDNNIRDIEREVNVYWQELVTETGWGFSLLSRMVHRLMVCLDILLECEFPQQFSTEKKTFFHPFRGRNRAHPYKYVPIGEGVFTQR